MRPAPTDTSWLEVEQLGWSRGRRRRRAEERRQEYAELLGEIAILEHELGISDEPPSGTVVVNGYRIPVRTMPDPGRREWR